MTNRPGRLHIGQVIVAQVTLVGLVIAYTGPAWLFAGVLAGAGAVGLATFGRTGDHWWYQAVAKHRRFARRRRRAAADVVAAAIAPRPLATHLVWLRTLAPGLRFRAVALGGTVVGIGADEAGWFGAVEVDGAGPGELPLAELAALVSPDGDRVPLSSSQAVVHPDGRIGWVAVRMSPVDAVKIQRGREAAAPQAAVAAGVLRAARMLGGLGHGVRVLEPDGMVAALIEANSLDGLPQEHWSMWRSGGRAHVCYAALGWPYDLPLAAPGARLVVSFTPGGGPGVLVRVTAVPNELARTSRYAVNAAATLGVRLRRLDGEHALAAYVCGPSGLPAASLHDQRAGARTRVPTD